MSDKGLTRNGQLPARIGRSHELKSVGQVGDAMSAGTCGLTWTVSKAGRP